MYQSGSNEKRETTQKFEQGQLVNKINMTGHWGNGLVNKKQREISKI